MKEIIILYLGIVIVFMILNTICVNKFVDQDIKLSNYMLLYWFCGIVIYPMLWFIVVKPESMHSCHIPGIIWPIIILLFHIVTNTLQTEDTENKVNHSSLLHESSVITGLALSIGGMIASINKTNQYKHAQIFMTALVMIIAFIVPSLSSIPPTSLLKKHIQIIQKIIFNFAVGFLLTGICLYVSSIPQEKQNQSISQAGT